MTTPQTQDGTREKGDVLSEHLLPRHDKIADLYDDV
jgi:hypothetical protein